MRLASALALGLLTSVVAGCAAERTLRIETEPPGAQVRLDDRAIGVTPITVDYTHYGTRRVTLHKDGYRTYSARIHLSPPWYARFPIDIVSEVLLPFGWTDRRRLRVDLEPGEEVVGTPTLRSVLDRADILRRAGPEGPEDLPPVETRVLPRIEEADEPSEDASAEDGTGTTSERP